MTAEFIRADWIRILRVQRNVGIKQITNHKVFCFSFLERKRQKI